MIAPLRVGALAPGGVVATAYSGPIWISLDANPTGATPTYKVLGKPTVNLPGCPPNPYNFLSTVVHFLTFGKLPAVEAEMRRLRAENQRLRAERDILKKATALFAREAL